MVAIALSWCGMQHCVCCACSASYFTCIHFSFFAFSSLPQRIAIVPLLCTPEVWKIVLSLCFSAAGVVVLRCCLKYLPLRMNGGWMTLSSVQCEYLFWLPKCIVYVSCCYCFAGMRGDLFLMRKEILSIVLKSTRYTSMAAGVRVICFILCVLLLKPTP